ncbi:hypothetical protein PsorP6_009220 [Peronosclerospora sorghi]|uniref:Uncharacterized protein n=1 Tax=Peronosclerospora sorghi TaxID=230839 RepID=A0ACC0VY13_9STRA|nr:hypothetical protein PsorP6_009220 [Peronosclerospora sorghi]
MSDDDDERCARERHRAHVSSVLSQLPQTQEEDEVDTSPMVHATARTTTTYSSNAGVPEDSPRSASHASSKYSSAGDARRRRKAFTGLSNQGATCYMNSLLQSMYMTPEFRQGLYRWTRPSDSTEKARAASDPHDDDETEENIPFQLQNLFAKLQLTTQDAISTKALTKSFGWTGADVFQQHDVQELCRVLLDALEKSFKHTVNEHLVNDLFQGALKDYVQCRACGYESSRIDQFLDLSLVIRPFGSSEMMKTVEEAIELFLRPEVLEHENQWMCERCHVKRDAIKGLKFSKLPYILMLQLKRFDFDYATMTRIKLHNQVTFPKYLDMNSYVSDEQSGARGKIARKMSMERHVLEGRHSGHKTSDNGASAIKGASSPPSTSLLGRRTHRLSSTDESHPMLFQPSGETVDDETKEDDDETHATSSFDTWSATFDPTVMIKRSGPHVYELYSILIHSGSALGGHYYAYIKSLETGKWYNFNDANVSEISDTELKTAFGGASGSTYSLRYSTCAYMLLYRLVSVEKNVNVIAPESIPDSLKARVGADEEKMQQMERDRLELAKKVQVKFYMKGTKPKSIEKALYLYKTATIREALTLACAAFANDKDVVVPSIENVRLRGYNDYTCLLSTPYDGQDDMTLTDVGIYAGQQLFLETKSDDEAWDAHDPLKLQLFVRRFHDGAAEAASTAPSLVVKCIQVPEDADLAALSAIVATKFRVPRDRKLRFLKKSATSYSLAAVKILNPSDEPSTQTLRLKTDLHLINGTEVYLEETLDLALASPAEAFFEREANLISVNFKYLTHPAEPISIDRRETIRMLKEKISAKIGLPSSAFKLLRGINSAGVEIKAIDSTLSKLAIGSNHTVFAVEGTPLNPGEYNFRLMLYDPGRKATSHDHAPRDDADKDLFELDDVFVSTAKDDAELVFVTQLVVSEEMMVDALREKVWHALVSNNVVPATTDRNPTVAHVRLRDLRQNTMTSVLVNGQKLVEASKLAVYEGRSLVAELLPAPETAMNPHRLVDFVYVNRATWRFVQSMRREVVVSTAEETAPEQSLALAASSAFSIPVERLRFARVPSHRDSVDILEVVKYDFVPVAAFAHVEMEYQELFLVSDESVLLTYMSKHEQQLIQTFLTKKADEKTRAVSAKYASSPITYQQYEKPKEAALVIRTRSRTSEQREADSGSSTGKPSRRGVRIQASSAHRGTDVAVQAHVSSDTDDEDETDFLTDKTDAVDLNLFGDLS